MSKVIYFNIQRMVNIKTYFWLLMEYTPLIQVLV